VRPGDVGGGREDHLVEEPERDVVPQLRLQIAGRAEVRLVLDGDEVVGPVVRVARRRAHDRPPVPALAFEVADRDRALDDRVGSVGREVERVGDGDGLARADGGFDGGVGDPLGADRGAVVEVGTRRQQTDVDDARAGRLDARAELAGDDSVRGFERGAQCQLEPVLHADGRDAAG